ncbi:MAG: hypothetical protein ACI87E_003012 [Mariniblastus sp.]
MTKHLTASGTQLKTKNVSWLSIKFNQEHGG